jgi:very-short-patch-repair endonuclease
MKFKDFRGREVEVNLAQSKNPIRDKSNCKSKIQWRVGQILQGLFPGFVLLEEFNIPGSRFYLDFLLPGLRIAIEVDGEQHYKFNKFHHRDRAGFLRAQSRDRDKEEWCALNNIKLIRIRKNEDIEEKILDALR